MLAGPHTLVIKGILQLLVVCEETLVLFLKPQQGSIQVVWPYRQGIRGGQRC